MLKTMNEAKNEFNQGFKESTYRHEAARLNEHGTEKPLLSSGKHTGYSTFVKPVNQPVITLPPYVPITLDFFK